MRYALKKEYREFLEEVLANSDKIELVPAKDMPWDCGASYKGRTIQTVIVGVEPLISDIKLALDAYTWFADYDKSCCICPVCGMVVPFENIEEVEL